MAGKSAYKEPAGYSCSTKKYGPPYPNAKGKDYTPIFDAIQNNMFFDRKNADCYNKQAINLFNIMKANLGAARKSVKEVKSILGRKNISAYCETLDTYFDVTGRSDKTTSSKYCK
jgi:hypothetical protein